MTGSNLERLVQAHIDPDKDPVDVTQVMSDEELQEMETELDGLKEVIGLSLEKY